MNADRERQRRRPLGPVRQGPGSSGAEAQGLRDRATLRRAPAGSSRRAGGALAAGLRVLAEWATLPNRQDGRGLADRARVRRAFSPPAFHLPSWWLFSCAGLSM